VITLVVANEKVIARGVISFGNLSSMELIDECVSVFHWKMVHTAVIVRDDSHLFLFSIIE